MEVNIKLDHNNRENAKIEINNNFQSNWFQTIEKFENMDLDKNLLESILLDFKEPLLVQQRAIKPCVDGHDVIIEAPAGSGKTTAVCIAILQLIDSSKDECQVLILVPDTKTAKETQATLSILGDNLLNFKCHMCDNERSPIEERKCYDVGVQVVVVKKEDIKSAVLCNVNDLLTDHYKKQIYTLFGVHLCWCSQIIALDSKLPQELKKFKEDFMNETVEIILKKDELFSLRGAKQFYIHCDKEENKPDVLCRLCEKLKNVRMVVFCNSRRNVDKLVTQLSKLSPSVLSMHVDWKKREKVVKNFKSGLGCILITTDYLVVGFKLLDSLIVNYDLPKCPSMYRERLGINFRCEKRRVVVSFVTRTARSHLTKVEQFYCTTILEIPEDYTIIEKDLPTFSAYIAPKIDLETTHEETQSTVEMPLKDNANTGVQHPPTNNLMGKKVTMKHKTSDKEQRINDENNINTPIFKSEIGNLKHSNKTIDNKFGDSKHNQSMERYSFSFFEFNDTKSDLSLFRDHRILSGTNHINFARSNKMKIMKEFTDVNFDQNLLSGLFYDFKTPLVVQQRALIPCIEGYDVLIEAPVGSGKTTAITITTLHTVNNLSNDCQALILVPSFEVVEQTHNIFKNLSRYMSNLKLHFCTGGASGFEVEILPQDVQIVIGTPGHVYDLLMHKSLKTEHIEIFVLDEVDKILYNTSHGQLHGIFQSLRPEVQVILSTSMLADLSMTQPFSRDIIPIVVKKEDIILHGAKQFYLTVEEKELKFDTVYDLYQTIKNDFPIIIFCNTCREMNELWTQMSNSHIPVSVLKEVMNQTEFEKFIEQFRRESKRVLITRDSFANSVNFEYVPFVINYSFPLRVENYVRRVQRSGRFKRKTRVITLLRAEENSYLDDLKRYYNVSITQVSKPYSEIVQMT